MNTAQAIGSSRCSLHGIGSNAMHTNESLGWRAVWIKVRQDSGLKSSRPALIFFFVGCPKRVMSNAQTANCSLRRSCATIDS